MWVMFNTATIVNVHEFTFNPEYKLLSQIIPNLLLTVFQLWLYYYYYFGVFTTLFCSVDCDVVIM